MLDFREFWKNPNRKDGLTIARGSAYTTIAELEYISTLMLEWIDKEDAITVESFYLSRNIPSGTFDDWVRRCPELQNAWDICVERIGERRERRGLEGKYNASLVSSTMPLYSKKYRAWKLQERKSNEEGAKQTIFVVREKMPETNDVMPRQIESAE
jgi:hypothetical protein